MTQQEPLRLAAAAPAGDDDDQLPEEAAVLEVQHDLHEISLAWADW